MRVLVLAGCMLCATTQAVNEPLELNAPDVMEWEVGHARHSAAAGSSASSNLRILFRPSDRAQPSPTRARRITRPCSTRVTAVRHDVSKHSVNDCVCASCITRPARGHPAPLPSCAAPGLKGDTRGAVHMEPHRAAAFAPNIALITRVNKEHRRRAQYRALHALALPCAPSNRCQ